MSSSLSDRWSFFRKVKSQEECQEEKESQQCNDQQCNDDEVVVQEEQQHTVYADTNADANTENVINAYLHETCLSQARLAEEATWQKEWQKEQEQEQQRESCEYTYNNTDSRNNHYKGLCTETMPTMPVLFIEEYVSDEFKKVGNKKLRTLTDWRVYVYYDSYKNVYVLNGTRRRSDETGMERRYPDIHMSFKSKSALAFYLRRSMCSWRHNLSVTMYSMYRSVIHLSTPGATPSFHSIHKCRSKFRSELFGYDDCRMSIKEFESYLKMLKEIGDDGLLFRPMKC